MSLTAANLQTIFDKLQSHALASGLFQRVNTHEPKNAPPAGLTAALWLDAIGPEPGGSGLNATNVRIHFQLRIYQSMLFEPQDAIDPLVLAATAKMLEAYSGDFTLDDTIQAVDLLGKSGPPLQAQAGYLQVQDKMMRVVTITIPVIINDGWSQEA